MKLKVLQSGKDSPPPWYGGGLRFTCTQCGNCCTGGPGYVWISKEEIKRLAGHLKLTPKQVTDRYCKQIGDRFSLLDNPNARGEHDCVFLKEEKVPSNQNGQKITLTRRVCTIYNFRPLQCRTWPFWDGTLATPDAWRNAAERCHGMNYGSRIFSREQIEALRDAKDWPEKPPTSNDQ